MDSRELQSTLLMDAFRRTRDPEAFECLYEANCGLFRRMIQARLQHCSVVLDGGDILQDAFFNIYRYPGRFRADRPAAFQVWASTIIHNTIRRHLKHHLRRQVVHELGSEYVLERSDPGGEPVELLAAREHVRGLQRGYLLLLGLYLEAYHHLGERDRAILHLVEVEGLRYREAAARLGVRAANMKMLVYRARRRIFKVIESRIEEEIRLSA